MLKKLASNTPASSCDPLSQLKGLNTTFRLFDITAYEVEKATLSFNSKRLFMNENPSFIFKHVADFISPKSCNSFNEFALNRSFTSYLILARVIPIHKSGSKSDVKNFRPISTLPFID